MKPNIKIHFLKFRLFDNNWYCDYEFLRLKSNNKSSTFCGNRFPWVYDASDTRVEIILMKERAGTEPWWFRELEVLYYGAYDQPNNHFVIFTKQSSILNTPFPNTEQNAYETYHFISSSRLDILYLTAINVCSKDQVICFDGPGIKSPVLQFTNNQSDWKCLSSTFQMMCKFSNANNVSTTVPHLHYQSMRARDYQVKHLVHITDIWEGQDISLEITTSDSKRTTKYIYYHPDTISSLSSFKLEIDNMDFGCYYLFDPYDPFDSHDPYYDPYCLYEGSSCLYGGIYIVQTVLSKDFETLSYCACHHKRVMIPSARDIIIDDLHNVSIVIIHYSEYSRESFFHATYRENVASSQDKLWWEIQWQDKQMTPQEVNYKEDTISATLPLFRSFNFIQMSSIQLSSRKMKYINISFHETETYLQMDFRHSVFTYCIHIAIFYCHHMSNIRGRADNQETIYLNADGRFVRHDYFQSIFINMSECNLFSDPVWILSWAKTGLLFPYELNTIKKFYLPAFSSKTSSVFDRLHLHPYWILFHIVKPQDASPDAIWRVQTRSCDIVSHVSLEVLTDDYQSSSVYGWNHFNSSYGVYSITIDKAINILFEAINPTVHERCFDESYYACPCYMYAILLRRHFTYNDQITNYIGGKTPQQSHFTFHNQR